MIYFGFAVHKQKNKWLSYRLVIPLDKIKWGLPIDTVNKSGLLPDGYIVVHTPGVIKNA